MITVNIREKDEFIKLGQALKKAGVVGSGVDAKMVILDGQVSVNGHNFPIPFFPLFLRHVVC